MKKIIKIVLTIISLFILLFSFIGIILFILFYIYREQDRIKEILKSLNRKIKGKSKFFENLGLDKKANLVKEKVQNYIEENISFNEDEQIEEKTDINDENKQDEKIIEDKIENQKIENQKIPYKKIESKNKLVNSARQYLEVSKEINSRQAKILEFIRKNKNANMKVINSKFNTVTQRTLRRDLDRLEIEGYILQQGTTRNSVYLFR